MMQHIQGISRNQPQVVSLEDTISQDNPVRFIDAFVHSINLEKIGFTPRVLKTEGRPSFNIKVFLKTAFYGLKNRFLPLFYFTNNHFVSKINLAYPEVSGA